MLRKFGSSFLAVVTFVASSLAQQSVPMAPTQVPNATARARARHNSSAQEQPPSRVPSPVTQPSTNLHTSYTGTIEGFVYWDASTIHHRPVESCDGLSLTVSLGTPLGSSGMQKFNPLSTQSNFKYVGRVGTYGVCTYGFNHLPIGQDIQVQVNVTKPLAFSPVAAPAVTMIGPIKISEDKCTNLEPALPSPSDLTSEWSTCGNYAFNVNFVLQSPAHIISSNSGVALLPPSSSTQPTLLSNTPKRGMLKSGPLGAQTPVADSVQGNSSGVGVQLNSQPLPPRVSSVISPQRSPNGSDTPGTAPPPLPAGIQTTPSANIGPTQTMSSQSGSPVARTVLPTGALSSDMPTQTAAACGQDSTFRILAVTGATYNTFLPSGKYTIWGCSFGSVANAKVPAPQQGQTRTVTTTSTATNPGPNEVFVFGNRSLPPPVVGAKINSWTDDSITVTFPSTSELGKSQFQSVPVQLYVLRGDGKATWQDGYTLDFW